MPRWISCHGVWLGGHVRQAAVARQRQLELGPPRRQLVVGQQDVRGPGAQVDADPVAGAQQGQATADGRLR